MWICPLYLTEHGPACASIGQLAWFSPLSVNGWGGGGGVLARGVYTANRKTK